MRLQKRNIRKYLAFSWFLFFTLLYSSAWSSDVVSSSFTSQSAETLWSSNSLISVDENLKYVNKGNNSSVVGNYFTGYYYDSILGYFLTDWSSSENQNVRVIGSTNACGNSYGYKLWGYAYSEYYGFVDFDYSDDVFIYYCIGDESLHGYAYNSDLGLQSFEWISFDIVVRSNIIATEPEWSDIFVNDSVDVVDTNNSTIDAWTSTSSSSSSSSSGSFPDPLSSLDEWSIVIGGDIIEFEAVEESLFYIIK